MVDMSVHIKTTEIIDRHNQFMSINYARYPLAMVQGKGVTLEDAEGKQYLDLFAGFGGPLLGHCHEELIAAVTRQANKLWHVGNLFHTEPQTQVAEAIGRLGFGGQCFFCHSGADANEAALKLARLYGHAHPGPNGPRYRVVSTIDSFHGRSFGTMPTTGQPQVGQHFVPLPPGHVHVAFDDIVEIDRAMDEDTVAVIVEPIQGEAGVRVPSDDYLPALRRLCDERDCLLIFDEVWTGCGRTGRFFAHQHWLTNGQVPDIATLAKGIGGGLAVGVCCATPEVATLFDWHHYGHAVHATTLGGNCLSMAVAGQLLEVIERDHLINHAEALGAHAIDRLRRFARSVPAVRQVRGRGLFIGIELDAKAQGAWFGGVVDVVNRCMEQGLLINGTQGTTIRLAPALIISQAQLDQGLDLLEAIIQG